ncbi:hypothetical protein [Mongoliitalea daihaiensis]|uniref:hypothetical protein n=1 Tax=Mongoliitalea daihaiensis TaxID=2782006 RepID=UPI001F2FE1D2|nr:hypothetical protein [Mongoliitalea daihaiensis]UJP66324.1 hypothetical protein IPZ59_06825 [Mongoliitalea daihaiensis]
MKYKNAMLLIFSFFFIFSSYGQNESNMWEVGIDALSLFSKNQLPSYSVFGRYRINPGADKGSFIRARVGYQIDDFENNSPNGPSVFFQANEAVNTIILLGYQREIISRPRNSMYIGGDFLFSKEKGFRETLLRSDAVEGGLDSGTLDKTVTSINFNSFIGFSYNLFPHLKLSFESGFFLGKTQMEELYNLTTPRGDRIAYGSVSSEKFEFGVLPFYQVFLTLNF